MLTSYAIAFGLTLLVETPFYVAALGILRFARPVRAVAPAVGVNVMTHPALWWSLTISEASLGTQIALEIMVCLAEWGLLRIVLRRNGLLLGVASVGANAASLLTGFVV